MWLEVINLLNIGYIYIFITVILHCIDINGMIS